MNFKKLIVLCILVLTAGAALMTGSSEVCVTLFESEVCIDESN